MLFRLYHVLVLNKKSVLDFNFQNAIVMCFMSRGLDDLKPTVLLHVFQFAHL